jgi:hypothetical protein
MKWAGQPGKVKERLSKDDGCTYLAKESAEFETYEAASKAAEIVRKTPGVVQASVGKHEAHGTYIPRQKKPKK